jgi:5'-nucleotidase (lipoprotein e(P4) family)
MTLRTPAAVLFCFLLAACATPAIKPSAPPAAAAPANDQLYAVAWQQTAIEYQSLTRTVYSGAQRRLAAVVQWQQQASSADSEEARAAASNALVNWNAMPLDERADNDGGQPLAIILDADETVIDNSAYQVRRIDADGGFDAGSWSAWVQERRALAVPGAVEFTQWAASQDIAVFYVTNRDAVDGAATADNLRALGFPLPEGDARLLLLDAARGFANDKVSRRQLVDRDYRVIGLFGDNLGDFVSGIRADNPTRARRLATYRSWWGDRWYMLPNTMYGTWVDALTKACAEATQKAPRDCMRDGLRRE